jgi:hypothetical protein
MTDLSGIGSNKTFKTGLAPGAPYYYISAHLDLSGAIVPSSGSLTYYFNKDNSLGYQLTPFTAGLGYEQYHKFHMIDENAVIGEVALYSNPDLVAGTVPAGQQVVFRVGGALDTASPVNAPDTWGGPTGFVAGTVNSADINTGSVCYFGHEGGGAAEDKKYLAISMSLAVIPPTGSADPEVAPEVEPEPQGEEPVVIIDENPRSLRATKKAKALRLVVPPSIASGSVYVVVKVYPKYQ